MEFAFSAVSEIWMFLLESIFVRVRVRVRENEGQPDEGHGQRGTMDGSDSLLVGILVLYV